MSDATPNPDDFANDFQAAFARLRIRVETACMSQPPSAWPARVAAAIRATLAFAAAHPDAGYVLTSGALAHGKRGFALYDRMLDHFSELLLPGRVEQADGEPLPEIVEKALAGGLATMIAHRVDTGRAAELPGFAAEAIQFVLTPYLGTRRARQVAGDESSST